MLVGNFIKLFSGILFVQIHLAFGVTIVIRHKAVVFAVHPRGRDHEIRLGTDSGLTPAFAIRDGLVVTPYTRTRYTALGHKLRFFRGWKAQFVTVGIIFCLTCFSESFVKSK